MAKKLNAIKLSHISRTHAEVTNRRRVADAALYLMQLQLPRWQISPLQKKLTVIMDADDGDAAPQFVKIIHVA